MTRLPSQGPCRTSPAASTISGMHAEERKRRRTRLELDRARERRDEDSARLGLPPGVDDRAAALADDAVVPLPGLGVDRFADRAQQAQRLAAGLLHRLLARAHQRTDGGRRGVEDVDLMLVDDLPEAAHRRIVRNALEHQGRRAVGERSVDDVGVTRHPADVGGAPVDVALVVVEDVLVRHRRKDEIAAGGVDDALGRAGRARRIEDEQRIFRVDRLGRALRRDALGRLVHPDVAARRPVDLAAGAFDDQHVPHASRLLDSDVGIGFQRHLAPAAQALVGGDDDFGLRVRDTAGERVGGEAAEHDRMDRADARAGEHRVGRLGDHRQVDGDAVALLDAMKVQNVGEAVHLVGEFGVGDVAGLGGIVAFPDDRGLVGALGQMAVDAIVGDIGHPVLEPFDRDVVRVEAGVLDLGVGLEPVDPFAVFAPESLRVTQRTLVHLLVLGMIDPSALRPFGGDVIDLVRHEFLPRDSCTPAQPAAASLAVSLCPSPAGPTSIVALMLWS